MNIQKGIGDYMKRQIRKGVFETNSSSVHALCLCTNDEYGKWMAGEYVYDCYNEELVPITPEIKEIMEEESRDNHKWDRSYLTYDQFYDYDYISYETFEETKCFDGKEIIAFGYSGYNG